MSESGEGRGILGRSMLWRGPSRKLLVIAAASLALLALPGIAIAQPPNDEIENATAVTEPLPFTDSVSTVDATLSRYDRECGYQSNTVWYSYTPSTDGFSMPTPSAVTMTLWCPSTRGAEAH